MVVTPWSLLESLIIDGLGVCAAIAIAIAVYLIIYLIIAGYHATRAPRPRDDDPLRPWRGMT